MEIVIRDSINERINHSYFGANKQVQEYSRYRQCQKVKQARYVDAKQYLPSFPRRAIIAFEHRLALLGDLEGSP